MVRKRTYLDYNASAPLVPAARDAMLDAIATDGNASSIHGEGRAKRAVIEKARRAVAGLVNVNPDHVVFTSGASEAASLVLSPRYRLGKKPLNVSRLFVGATEHPCVLAGGRFAAGQREILPVNADGLIVPDDLQRRLAQHDRDTGHVMVAIQAANNETGVIQPLADIHAICRAAGALLVVDAAQAAGRIPVDMTGGYGDFLILSAHKLGGPAGIGALVATSDLLMPEPLVKGGGQESGHRGGTEASILIAGFGAAALACEAATFVLGTGVLQQRLEAGLTALAADTIIFGGKVPRLSNTTLVGWPGLSGQTVQIALDLAGLAVSSGSACSSGKVGPSHVLSAMGVESADGGLRLSWGKDNTAADIDLALAAIGTVLARRRTSSAAA
jgi:cysteine desulfurase